MYEVWKYVMGVWVLKVDHCTYLQYYLKLVKLPIHLMSRYYKFEYIMYPVSMSVTEDFSMPISWI